MPSRPYSRRFPMFAVRPLICLLPCFCIGVALGQDEAGTEANASQKKGEAEVQFANGSTVRMAIVQDKVEVQTRYGKLAIPLADIQRIEFGVHLPPDIAKRVEEAVLKLASVQYAEREDGCRE